MIELPTRTKKRYGWLPDIPDMRDIPADEFADRTTIQLKPVPAGTTKFSLRSQDAEPPFDQSQLGSCTANGWAYQVQFRRNALGLPVFRPSRLFIYYYERVIEGTPGSDSGAQIRDGAKVVHLQGAPDEMGWPYDISKFTDVPPQAEQQAGQLAQVQLYARVPQKLDRIKQFIYNGYPVVMGFTVYESFESSAVAQTGRMPVPQSNEQALGGHCTVWMGWDDSAPVPNSSTAGALETRNSWGLGWGDGGYYWFPYACALNRGMSSDFWVAETVEG